MSWCSILKKYLENFSKYSPQFFLDAVKYKPVQEFLKKRNKEDRLRRAFFISKGIREGYFIDTLNYHLLEQILHAAIMFMVNNNTYKEYSMKDIFNTYIMVFLRGMLTEKGLRELYRGLAKHNIL